jgi:uncharacterized ion transporter superfamily protein YfcC
MYVLVATFVILHARHVERNSASDLSWPEEQAARARYRQSSDDVTFVTPRRAVTWSVCCLGAMLAVVLLGTLVPALQTYSLPIIGLAFMAAGLGDGFSNLMYPTNAVLLIGLGLTSVSYPRWFRWTMLLQLATLVVTAASLLLAVSLHFGPF